MSNTTQFRDGQFYFLSGSLSSSIQSNLIGQGLTIGTWTVGSRVTKVWPSRSGSEYVTTLTVDPNDSTSFYISGSTLSSSMYMSGSGRVGFGTTDPRAAFDVRADDFQIQKQGVKQGVKVNKEGNLESFNEETDAAATGSEFLLTYTRGGSSVITKQFLEDIGIMSVAEIDDAFGGDAQAAFATFHPVDQDKILHLLGTGEFGGFLEGNTAGDVLGSIRWIAASGSRTDFDRTAGEAAKISVIVDSFTDAGITADMSFLLTANAGDVATQVFRLDAAQEHEFTGSLNVRGSVRASNTDLGSGISLYDADGNAIANLARIGSGANAHIGRMVLRDNANVKVDIRATGNSYINGTSARLGIGTDSPGKELTVHGDVSASGLLFTSASNAGTNPYLTVLIDTGSGQIYYTGSYSSGGGSSADNLGNHTATQALDLDSNNITNGASGSFSYLKTTGNISSSGALSIFGEIVHLEGTDPRLKLKAKGANHPGIEWHEDSTRKWILYSDPDSSQGANDNLTWKNASDTELMELDQDGMLYVSSKIIHLDDTDTYINFTDDSITLTAGNTNLITLTESTTNTIALGAAISTPITASSNISASGNIYMKQTAGTDNSVVVLSNGKLVTDEIDSGVWGGTGAVLTVELETEAPALTVGKAAVLKTARTIGGTTFDGSSNITPATSSHAITSSHASKVDPYYTWEVTTRAATGDDDNWQGPNTKGILTMEDWGQDYSTYYDDTSTTYAAARTYMNTGWIIPHGANYSCSIKSFDIYLQANTNQTYADADGFSCSLWYSKNSDLASERNVFDSNSGTFVQRHGATVTDSQCKAADEALFKYNNYHVSQSVGLDLAPGSIVYPRIKTVGTNDYITNIHWIVNYQKIPL